MSFSSPDMSVRLGILSSLLYVFTFIVGGALGVLVHSLCVSAHLGHKLGFYYSWWRSVRELGSGSSGWWVFRIHTCPSTPWYFRYIWLTWGKGDSIHGISGFACNLLDLVLGFWSYSRWFWDLLVQPWEFFRMRWWMCGIVYFLCGWPLWSYRNQLCFET